MAEPPGAGRVNSPEVIFVGAFQAAVAGGGIGGQLYACRVLLESPLRSRFRWVLIDSTMSSVPPPPLWKRTAVAIVRLTRFTWHAVARPRARVLIFVGDGPSFLEKGVMVMVAAALGHWVVLCPRSGMVVDDLRNSAVYRWFIPRVLRCADVVICQGERWRDFYRAAGRLDDNRLMVIPNWIRVADYATPVRRENAAAAAGVVFLFLGWLEEFKGAGDLIAAIAEAAGRLDGAVFEICGDGSMAARLKQEVEHLGISRLVRFRGWVEGKEKQALLSVADVLVIPSRREGMPNAALEAMASGIPVLATRVGGLPDLVTDGETGWLVDAADPQALAQALERCVRERWRLRDMGLAAARSVRNNHDIDVAWPKMQQALSAERPNDGIGQLKSGAR